MNKEDLSSAAYCLMHPARLKIIQLLKKEPSNFTQISKSTGLKRSLTAYHISFLLTHSFLESEYKLEERDGQGYASKRYWCSAKVNEVIHWIEERLEEIKDGDSS